jgi:hypothetical protein
VTCRGLIMRTVSRSSIGLGADTTRHRLHSKTASSAVASSRWVERAGVPRSRDPGRWRLASARAGALGFVVPACGYAAGGAPGRA